LAEVGGLTAALLGGLSTLTTKITYNKVAERIIRKIHKKR